MKLARTGCNAHLWAPNINSHIFAASCLSLISRHSFKASCVSPKARPIKWLGGDSAPRTPANARYLTRRQLGRGLRDIRHMRKPVMADLSLGPLKITNPDAKSDAP